jgi:hypothetical protein
MNGRTLIREPPGQEGAAIDGMLEPRVQFRRGVTVEKNLHYLVLFASEFANLQAAGMRRSFPIDVPRALERFVGADAVEIVA